MQFAVFDESVLRVVGCPVEFAGTEPADLTFEEPGVAVNFAGIEFFVEDLAKFVFYLRCGELFIAL